MKLIYQRNHRSITQFDPIELQNFSILTGVNGAGKSHLLEAIEQGHIIIEGIQPNQANMPKHIRRFSWHEMYPQGAASFASSQVASEQSNYWHSLEGARSDLRKTLKQRLTQFDIPDLNTLDIELLPKLSKNDLLTMGLDDIRAESVLADIKGQISTLEANVRSKFLVGDTSRERFLAQLDKKSNNAHLLLMSQEDFYNNFPLIWQPGDLFEQSFARLFTTYNRALMLNKLKRIAKDEGERVTPLSDKEFVQKNGRPPWEIVNEVLAAAEIDFRMQAPYYYDDRPYNAVLFDPIRKINVGFGELSSGERILMSFALCLYHARDENTCTDFPKVLLFDEIDAPLHPSMTKALLNAIQQILVDKYQIKVILTTHSPSTIALSPEANIFVMGKDSNPRIKSTTKDMALGILTAGVPMLSVDYRNRRQVFVESDYDVQIYDRFYRYSKSKLNPEISLAFISSGKQTDGGCIKVKSIVDKLSFNGANTVRGIVDWDNSNESTGCLFVLGEKERYSIENFVFDPVLLGFFLLREKFLNPVDLGLGSEFKYVSINSLTEDNIQEIADKIITFISNNLILDSANDKDPSSKVFFEYENGKRIKVPRYFSLIQGHKLEEAAKITFPQLKRYHQEPELKVNIIEKVINDFPGFIPKSIINLFSNLQN